MGILCLGKLCLGNAASPSWTSHILNRNVLMLSLGGVFTRDSGYTAAEKVTA